MSNRVFLGPAQDKVDVKERPAAVEILPGKVLVLDDGEFALAGADQAGVIYFAGNNILDDLDDAYAAGDTVQGYRPRSGQYYQARLAASQVVAEDAALSTNATGDLVVTDAKENVIGYAAEAVTTTASAGFVRVYMK